jgi:CheY-like chemotaxis protein
MQKDDHAGKSRQRLIILVDADDQSRLLCRTALSAAGFEVITASDAATALLVAGFTAPDVILLDVDQPALSSLVRAHDIRTDRRLGDSRIIALTGQLTPPPHQERATRFDRILIKPADEQQILEVVGGALMPA